MWGDVNGYDNVANLRWQCEFNSTHQLWDLLRYNRCRARNHSRKKLTRNKNLYLTLWKVSLDIKENPEAFRRSKRKRIPWQAETDMLNECLCGLVVKLSSEGSLLCKKKGCETQWVCDFLIRYLTLLTLIFSTIYNVYLWSRHLDIGFAWPVVSLRKDEGGSASDDDVILLYLDWCLIT